MVSFQRIRSVFSLCGQIAPRHERLATPSPGTRMLARDSHGGTGTIDESPPQPASIISKRPAILTARHYHAGDALLMCRAADPGGLFRRAAEVSTRAAGGRAPLRHQHPEEL